MSETTKCGEKDEQLCENANEFGKTDGLEKAVEEVRISGDANAVVRKRGRPCKGTVDSTSLDDKMMSMMTKYGLQEHRGINAAVVRKCGWPCKRPVGDSSFSDLHTYSQQEEC